MQYIIIGIFSFTLLGNVKGQDQNIKSVKEAVAYFLYFIFTKRIDYRPSDIKINY
jgi:hypothetical protein